MVNLLTAFQHRSTGCLQGESPSHASGFVEPQADTHTPALRDMTKCAGQKLQEHASLAELLGNLSQRNVMLSAHFEFVFQPHKDKINLVYSLKI